MRWLRSIVRCIARFFGLYDDGRTEIHHKRAAWNAEVDGRYLQPLRDKEKER